MKVDYYTDVLSLWCAIAEDTYERLRDEFGGEANFECKLACVEGGKPMGVTLAMEEWFYNRCAFVTGHRFNPEWLDDASTGTYYANAAVQAISELGGPTGAVRKALIDAGVRRGEKVARRDIAVGAAASASGIAQEKIDALLDGPVRTALSAVDDEFKRLGGTQRPTFVLSNDIGDRCLLSGMYDYEPVAAVLRSMLRDERRYADFAGANTPCPPPSPA